MRAFGPGSTHTGPHSSSSRRRSTASRGHYSRKSCSPFTLPSSASDPFPSSFSLCVPTNRGGILFTIYPAWIRHSAGSRTVEKNRHKSEGKHRGETVERETKTYRYPHRGLKMMTYSSRPWSSADSTALLPPTLLLGSGSGIDLGAVVTAAELSPLSSSFPPLLSLSPACCLVMPLEGLLSPLFYREGDSVPNRSLSLSLSLHLQRPRIDEPSEIEEPPAVLSDKPYDSCMCMCWWDHVKRGDVRYLLIGPPT